MCVIPSKIEFDEMEAQERKFERELETRLKAVPKAEREAKKRELLRFSTLRFAGVMSMMAPH